jgi:hypothetical protein
MSGQHVCICTSKPSGLSSARTARLATPLNSSSTLSIRYLRPSWVRSSTKSELGINGQSLGNGTAFFRCGAFAAGLCDAHQFKIFGSGIPIMSPPGPNTWTLNILPLGQFAPHCDFLLTLSTSPRSVAICYIPSGKLPVRFNDL